MDSGHRSTKWRPSLRFVRLVTHAPDLRTADPKPLRADAQRNRRPPRSRPAARSSPSAASTPASTRSPAHAGVGVGTAYRRFPNKEALIDEIFEERIREITAMLEEALALDDPWEGLQRFITDLLRFQAQDRGLKQAFHENDETQSG